MELGATLYIKNTIQAIAFYQEAFGMSLGYCEKFSDGSYMHAELKRDGKTVFSISECNNERLVADLHRYASKQVAPVTSLGIEFSTEAEVRKAYECLAREGTVYRELGELPWSKCSADVLDKYGVYWYIYINLRA